MNVGMRLIKKLDIFILKAYLQLFAGTFFICLFIFLMQFVWRYVDELIGKGLSWDVLAQFLWYSALTIVPLSTPLAVLLASLISFGNLGERFELLSMKASGVPLIRIFCPVFVFALMVCAGSFYFQNKISPNATRKLYSVVYGMKMKSPELEIPEGIFYSDIPGYNLFVERKDSETGMLYGVMIYTNSGGYEDTDIVLADSARIQSTDDHRHLKLTMYNGERFRNMDNQSGNMFRASVPYMRESFIREVDLITFDTNINLLDPNLFTRDAGTKDLMELGHTLDSLDHAMDSVGHSIYHIAMQNFLNRSLPRGIKDSLAIVSQADTQEPFDTLYARLDDNGKAHAWKGALSHASSVRSEYDFRAQITADSNGLIRKHRMEMNRKFSLSLACMLFFFIGAPLGAIIRKGGLGVPVVISVVIFIFYYIVNASGENNAKVGVWAVPFGSWLSSAILLPVGMFLIYKANKDSVVFNLEGYVNFFRRLLGLRASRKLARKEVVIEDPDYVRLVADLGRLTDECKAYVQAAHLRMLPNYVSLFFRSRRDGRVKAISAEMERIVDELHNSRDNAILTYINDYPILPLYAHTHPFSNPRMNVAAGLFLPLGLFFYFRVWRYRLRLWVDMQTIQRLNAQVVERITKLGLK